MKKLISKYLYHILIIAGLIQVISCNDNREDPEIKHLTFYTPKSKFYYQNEKIIDSLVDICKEIDLSAKDTVDFSIIDNRFYFLKLGNDSDSTFKQLHDNAHFISKKGVFMQNQVFKLENETFIFLSNNFDSPKQEHTKWEWKTLVIQRDSLLCIKHQKFGNQQRKIVIPSDKEQKKYRNMIANMKYNYENPLFKTN